MEKISNLVNKLGLIPFIVLSILVHSLGFWICLYKKKQNLFVQVPYEVSFYSPVQNVSVKKTEVVEKKEEVINNVKKEEVKEEKITKDDIVIKKKEKKKKEKKIVEKKEEPKVEKPVAQKEVSQETSTGTGVQSSQAVSSSKGIMLENKNFKYSYYTNTIVKKIRRYWQWSGVTDVCRAVVYFKILKDGTVAEAKIAESSKNEEFDQNAVRAVQLSSPFAPLPVGYNEDYLGVYFEFKFN